MFDNTNYIWNKIDKAQTDLMKIRFYIYSVDFGEWGGKLGFKDKKASSICSRIYNTID
jgi:hypothetical protein